MNPDQLVIQQLTGRLRRIRSRISTLTAEAEMIQRMLADAEKSVVVPRLRLRKNSQGKWTVRGLIRRYLEDAPGPVRAQAIYDALRRHDPSLNASTYRSHLRRMVDENIVKRDGPRGHYQLVIRPEKDPEERNPSRRRNVTIGNDFI